MTARKRARSDRGRAVAGESSELALVHSRGNQSVILIFEARGTLPLGLVDCDPSAIPLRPPAHACQPSSVLNLQVRVARVSKPVEIQKVAGLVQVLLARRRGWHRRGRNHVRPSPPSVHDHDDTRAWPWRTKGVSVPGAGAGLRSDLNLETVAPFVPASVWVRVAASSPYPC